MELNIELTEKCVANLSINVTDPKNADLREVKEDVGKINETGQEEHHQDKFLPEEDQTNETGQKDGNLQEDQNVFQDKINVTGQKEDHQQDKDLGEDQNEHQDVGKINVMGQNDDQQQDEHPPDVMEDQINETGQKEDHQQDEDVGEVNKDHNEPQDVDKISVMGQKDEYQINETGQKDHQQDLEDEQVDKINHQQDDLREVEMDQEESQDVDEINVTGQNFQEVMEDQDQFQDVHLMLNVEVYIQSIESEGDEFIMEGSGTSENNLEEGQDSDEINVTDHQDDLPDQNEYLGVDEMLNDECYAEPIEDDGDELTMEFLSDSEDNIEEEGPSEANLELPDETLCQICQYYGIFGCGFCRD